VREALRGGRLDAARALAELLARSGHPLGPLYSAALAFEAGDEAAARAAAAASRVPLSARGLGARLAAALAARDAGARSLLLDRNGELVASLPAAGPARPAKAAVALVSGVLERLPAELPAPAARLTLDLELSRMAFAALGERRGSVVLVDARSGPLLAAVSDARTSALEGAAAFTQRLEPASIAKLLTAAAAYRNGLDPDASISRMTCTGVERYGGQPLWCPWPAGRLAGLDDALAKSCNVAFANLGVELGVARMAAEYRLWGFDAGPAALLGGAGRIHTIARTPRQLADLAIGLELVDVTPLHAALLAAVVADDGRMPEPRVLDGPCGRLGLSDGATAADAAREVLNPAVARRLRLAMAAVARRGTGAGLAPFGYEIEMKTGTAAERGRGYHVNYVGIAPLGETTLAFCVRVTHGSSSPKVTTAAREVTRRLLAGLAERAARGPLPRF
jgi:cell division protein FtsI/penicillin-binding protein 2